MLLLLMTAVFGKRKRNIAISGGSGTLRCQLGMFTVMRLIETSMIDTPMLLTSKGSRLKFKSRKVSNFSLL